MFFIGWKLYIFFNFVHINSVGVCVPGGRSVGGCKIGWVGGGWRMGYCASVYCIGSKGLWELLYIALVVQDFKLQRVVLDMMSQSGTFLWF